MEKISVLRIQFSLAKADPKIQKVPSGQSGFQENYGVAYRNHIFQFSRNGYSGSRFSGIA
jgi:hypothetical protein